MADPANVFAATSTSQRKRVLQSQLRSEAKRRRRSLSDSHSSSRHRVPSSTNSNSQVGKTRNTAATSHNNPPHPRSSRSRWEDSPSSSTSNSRERIGSSGGRKYCTRDSTTSNHIDLNQQGNLDKTNRKNSTTKGSSVNKPKSNSEAPSTSSGYKGNTDNKRYLRRSSSVSRSQRSDNISKQSSKSNSREDNSRRLSLRSHSDKLRNRNFEGTTNTTYSEDCSTSSSTNINTAQAHHYSLRSQSKFQHQSSTASSSSSSNLDSTNKNQSHWKTSIPRKRKTSALGTASSSNSGTRATAPPPQSQHGTAPNSLDSQSNESNRLTRSGAVLRRSTRTKRGQGTSTTGSCASSSGGASSGSGAASGRGRPANNRNQKSRLPLPVATRSHTQLLSGLVPTSQSAAHAMAADQPPVDVPSGSLTDETPASHESSTQSASGAAATAAAATSGTAGGGPSGTGADSESDDSEVGRLQALLEARGLPPHLFGALGPRMQHLLHRSMGSNSSVTRAQALIPGLQATGDEGQQLQAVIEMCQILVMGNEEILTGFPVKQVVPALISLLQMEHNFDIMNHACRALSYMMEALPRSSAVVVDAVPVFLEKLQVIQCMDVAEQSLTALDMLSRRHSKSILQARGVAACLTYLDFFPINAQRNAFSVTANCCLNLTNDEFQYVQSSLPLLASRLTQQDKKCVESVCLAFSRLVDSFQLEPNKLQEIASPELLTNLQQLLVVTPPIISTPTFITVLRMLSVMCSNCPDLAITLLKQSIAETLFYLLTGSTEINQDHVDLVSRQPQELFEITSLIGELMPKLPTDGIFSVDSLLEKTVNIVKDQPVWQWRDDRGWWHPYGAVDSRIIESAHQNGEDEVSLNTIGRIYTVDFHAMQQVNEDTGTSRPVQRLCTPAACKPSTLEPTQAAANRPASSSRDARVACLREERGLAAAFIRSLFAVLYEVYSSSAGPAVRYKCLRALLRMVYYASPKLLKEVLKNQIVSSHLAGMMASSDLRIVVGALQMAEILMNKLPDDFGVHFRREGVFYQINRLADPEVPLGVSPPKSTSCISTSILASASADSQPSTSQSVTSNSLQTTTINGSTTLVANNASLPLYSSTPDPAHRPHQQDNDVRSPNSLRLGDVLRRKRVSKRSSALAASGSSGAGGSSTVGTVPSGGPSSSSNRQKARQDDLPLSPSLMQDFFNKAATLANSASSNSQPNNSRLRYSSSTSKTSFLQNLNPARWARSMNSSHDRNFGKDSLNSISKSSSNSQITAGNKEKARQWIREQANIFIETYSDIDGDQHPATAILNCLKLAIEKLSTSKCREALLELREILIESDISPFEVNHSGLIKALLSYLSDVNGTIDRDQRLRILLNVFGGFPLETGVRDVGEVNSEWMQALVTKLNRCVSHLEQFPVKVHDFPTSAGVGRGCTSALKFFNTHQLKCNLQRHPECNNLKQWKGGTVKIDPLALVQAIERYLLVRGYGRLKDKDSADSEDGDSDTDIDDTLASVAISQAGSKHKLQFLIGNNVLPHNMTVYQAVRQFSFNGNDQSETDTDNETPMSNAGIWVQTHVIYYRPIKEELSANHKTVTNSAWNHSSRKGKGSSGKNSSRRKVDELWSEGITPVAQSLLKPYLTMQLPDTVTIQDSSLEVLCVLRILHALNLYWGTLYTNTECGPILPSSVFINSKIAAKANRQLQDPLVIMTGNLPKWLNQIATACPFLFPFETRQLLFYATSFDRDRALQRLIEITPELSSNDSQERVTPRLDRRKRTISREDILKQAEQVMQDLAGSKALLEVQYEDEVGTGLGPTLEFYALVSKELQKHSLDLWYAPNASQSESEYVHNPMGLFPGPIAKGAKLGPITKIKSKYRFIGKLMAKAVMDSRMLDLPFSVTFYRWLLGQEHSLTLADLLYVNSDLYITLKKMQDVVSQRDSILADINLTEEEKTEQIEKLEFDGCLIEDLGIDFVIPGYNVELMKNGKNIHVTIHNLHLYVKLLIHWMLVEGVSRQMEALREGFDSVFPSRHLSVFQPDELEQVFCGASKDQVTGWDEKTLMECCKPDHGYTADSKAIRFLFELLSSYNKEEQRMFVQFLTGSPRLPVGGFKALSPPLTIVRKTTEGKENPDDFLPSVMTCVNYLKLPDYSSIEVMRQKLAIAASEGQHSFYLS